jgi:hypothetical protein
MRLLRCFPVIGGVMFSPSTSRTHAAAHLSTLTVSEWREVKRRLSLIILERKKSVITYDTGSQSGRSLGLS